MKTLILSTMVLFAAVVGDAATRPLVAPYESGDLLTPGCQIDKLVYFSLRRKGINPNYLCSDAVFVRRVFLDAIGTLPTLEETRDFLKDPAPNKRSVLIDGLLERREFADYWAMKWSDLLRVKAEFPVDLWPNAAQAYHHWIRASIARNMPYDRFARELLTSSGSNVRVGPANFYRAIQNRTPEGITTTVALTFMGSRAEFWPKERLQGTSAFFSQIGYKPTREWKEEVVFWDPLHSSVLAKASGTAPEATTAPSVDIEPQAAVFPDGTRIQLPADRDPRDLFADWLISPNNPWFARNIVNRVWSWFEGRGIIQEPDDIRPDNPPSNPALLAYLEQELVASHYDLKHLFRLILNSQVYQSSSVPQTQSHQADALFASYTLRRLDAEVLIDAINQITGSTDLYTSPIPEPFTYIPQDQPAIALPDGSITSPFLELFGHSARATGMENERNNNVVSAQWLHLLNSSHIQRKLDQSLKLRHIFESGRKPEEIITDLYLTILSRFPTPDELAIAQEYGQSSNPVSKGNKRATVKRRDEWVDIAWALINSEEFMYRH